MDGRRLTKLCSKAGIDYKELANRLGLKDYNTRLWFDGHKKNPITLCRLIAQELDIDIRELFEPDENEPKDKKW